MAPSVTVAPWVRPGVVVRVRRPERAIATYDLLVTGVEQRTWILSDGPGGHVPCDLPCLAGLALRPETPAASLRITTSDLVPGTRLRDESARRASDPGWWSLLDTLPAEGWAAWLAGPQPDPDDLGVYARAAARHPELLLERLSSQSRPVPAPVLAPLLTSSVRAVRLGALQLASRRPDPPSPHPPTRGRG